MGNKIGKGGKVQDSGLDSWHATCSVECLESQGSTKLEKISKETLTEMTWPMLSEKHREALQQGITKYNIIPEIGNIIFEYIGINFTINCTYRCQFMYSHFKVCPKWLNHRFYDTTRTESKLLRVCLLGAGGMGKTSMILKYMCNHITTDELQTKF